MELKKVQQKFKKQINKSAIENIISVDEFSIHLHP